MPSQILFFWNDCANHTRTYDSTRFPPCQYKIRETKQGSFRAQRYTFTTAEKFFCKLSIFFQFQLVVKVVVKLVVKMSKLWSNLWLKCQSCGQSCGQTCGRRSAKLLSCQILFVLLSFSACAPNFLSKILGKD